MADTEPQQSEFEISRAQARKAQIAMNVLVILSSVAASVFLFYVLVHLQPFGSRDNPEVDIATSAVPPQVPVLRGGKDGSLEVQLRDLDDATTYRDKLNDAMRKSLGVSAEGRLYRLRIHSGAKEPVEIAAPALEVQGGGAWKVQWLSGVASRDAATATGRLTLDQGAAEYTLAPGESRQLVVFIPGDAPTVRDMTSGEFTARGLRVPLTREEEKAGTQ